MIPDDMYDMKREMQAYYDRKARWHRIKLAAYVLVVLGALLFLAGLNLICSL